MRTAAAWAGIGLAVGAVLVGLLRLAVGADVLGAAGLFGEHGMPRRYVDYLPSVADAGSSLHVLVVLLGSGLLAGLLIGGLLGAVTSRRAATVGRRMSVVGPALVGLVLGGLLDVALYVNVRDRTNGDFGWYAYSPLRNGVFYGGAGQLSWPVLAVVGTLAGAALGLLAGALTAALPGGRLRGSTSPSG